MRIDFINNTTFGNKKSDVLKYFIRNKKIYTNIKPIKNYSQYMREYGLKDTVDKTIDTLA